MIDSEGQRAAPAPMLFVGVPCAFQSGYSPLRYTSGMVPNPTGTLRRPR